jgi:T5orf172 domain
MNTIIHHDIEYVQADYLLEHAPIYTKGCRGTRAIIKNKNIDEKNYIFMKLVKDQWILSNGNSNKFDKVFFKKSFMDTITELNEEKPEKIMDDKGIEKAPDIIELEKHQKFKDENGYIIEIETRGELNHEHIYFKVKDVMSGFNIHKLNDTLININSKYELNKHYKYFICNKTYNIGNNAVKKEMFLTYEGILRVLFVSENNKTTSFISWATKTLFTAQLGTIEQKEELVSELMGVHPITVKNVFNTNVSKTPCVYLYLIGNANQLLYGDYSDTDLLCKFGCTDDLPRRCEELHKQYGKAFNTTITLLYFSIVDIIYKYDAETMIKLYFRNNIIVHENHKELVIINKKELSDIKKIYENIQRNFIGRYEEINNKMISLEKEILMLHNSISLNDEKHKNELKDKEIEIMKEKYEKELIKKELEIMKLKLEK